MASSPGDGAGTVPLNAGQAQSMVASPQAVQPPALPAPPAPAAASLMQPPMAPPSHPSVDAAAAPLASTSAIPAAPVRTQPQLQIHTQSQLPFSSIDAASPASATERPKSSRPIRSTTVSRMEAEEKITGAPRLQRSASARKREQSAAGSMPSASGGRAPRLRLNMRAAGTGVGGQGPKTTPYMQGYDRELDSSDDETGEGLAFEEQLILRMPPGPECDKLRDLVRKRELGTRGATEVEFKFKDSRRATFRVGTSVFAAKLVDLPSIVESHKTLDNRQLFKVADISQMLLVTHRIDDDAPPPPPEAGANNADGATKDKFNIDDFIYPHGLTPPMRWARKRRFRKRTNKRTIETVEKELERLMADDDKAEEVEFEMIDAAEADMSDSDAGSRGGRGARHGSEMDDGSVTAATPRDSGMGDMDSQMGDGDDDGASVMGSQLDADEEVDEDLAAELEAALEQEDLDDDDSDNASASLTGRQSRASEDGDLWDADADAGDRDGEGSGGEDGGGIADEDGADSDEEGEQAEIRVREDQLEAECREIDAMVRRKQMEADATVNTVIKRRQQDALKRLVTERDLKRAQLADLKQERRERREAAAEAAAAAAQERALQKEAEAERDAQKDKEAAAAAAGKDKEHAVVLEGDATAGAASAVPAAGVSATPPPRKTAAEKGKSTKKSSASRSPTATQKVPTPSVPSSSSAVPIQAVLMPVPAQTPAPYTPSHAQSTAQVQQQTASGPGPMQIDEPEDDDGEGEEEDDLWAADDDE